jgi:flavin reductase (DIM6/NTAB) family NADH-FMN oxidoreductase RutF
MEQPIGGLSKADVYKLLNCIVVPRPIAWITSVSDQGVVNLAPYSTFTIVSYDPPLLGVNILFQAEDGRRKDTARNILTRREYVVHIADENLADALHLSSFPHPPDVSEVQLLGLGLEPGIAVKAPRLRDAPLALECRLSQVIQFGPGAEFVVGEVVHIHSRDGLVTDNKIHSAELRPLSRLGGPVYGTLGRLISKPPGGR